MKIGLFFGSFNPIHTGHLIIADYMLEYAGFDELWLVVSPQNPFKKNCELASDLQRLEWVRESVKNHPKLRVSDVEFGLPKPSYTINTLEFLQKKHTDTQFSLIIGSDNLERLQGWKDYQTILDNYKIYIFPRLPFVETPFYNHPSVVPLPAPIIEISSSMIRERINTQKSIRYLVAENIRQEVEYFYCQIDNNLGTL